MTFKLTATLFIILTFASCEKTKIKRLKVENLIAEGEISKDTVYNGFIKFYDASTNNLVETAIYKSGELNGVRILYYPNGKTRISTKYSNGKSNGETKVFDTTGNIIETQNSYYNLRVGQSLQYKKGQVSQYHFYSLENKELLHIDYDSIQGKRVEQLNDSNFFFWHLDNYNTSESNQEKTELFLYLPNPPKLNFKYSLCLIDNKNEIKKTIKEFAANKIWDIVNLDYSNLKVDEFFAIHLTIDNEFDNDNAVANMLKRL